MEKGRLEIYRDRRGEWRLRMLTPEGGVEMISAGAGREWKDVRAQAGRIARSVFAIRTVGLEGDDA